MDDWRDKCIKANREAEHLRAELTRLQEAKRGALAIADARSKENASLRAALTRIIDLNPAIGRLEVPQTKIAREALGK